MDTFNNIWITTTFLLAFGAVSYTSVGGMVSDPGQRGITIVERESTIHPQEIQVTGQHLPELYLLGLTNEPVFLKIYVPNPASPEEQKLLFLGQVSDVDRLSITVPIPQDGSPIHYQIYNPSTLISGMIPADS